MTRKLLLLALALLAAPAAAADETFGLLDIKLGASYGRLELDLDAFANRFPVQGGLQLGK